MTELLLTDRDPSELRVDALVVGVARDPAGRPVLLPGAERVDRAFRGQLADTLRGFGATGREGEVTRLATWGALPATSLVAVGVGDTPDRRRVGRSAGATGTGYPDEALRRAAGAAVRRLRDSRSVGVALALADGGPSPDTVRAVAEGALLGSYAFSRYRTAASAERTHRPVEAVSVAVPRAKDRGFRAGVARAAATAAGVALARDLVNTTPNHMRPADFADACVAACRDLDVQVEVLDEAELRRGGYGGILGVGPGSANPPRLVRMDYRPPRARWHLAVAGKGITFDSGGLSLKPADSMEWMKSDMSGAAAVLGVVTATARLGLPVRVTGWAPTAENMPGGGAIRPSDVLTIYGGTTVEVLNTDAEGRLVLADALVRAGEEHPDAIVDLATLTGAQVIALGSRTFAVMGNDERWRDDVVAAAGRAGEEAWPMPLPEELRESLHSHVADIKNIGDRERGGGMLVAGLFLSEFVPPGVPWAHLDIAGPAFNKADSWGYTPRGGTGVGVRTLVELLHTFAER